MARPKKTDAFDITRSSDLTAGSIERLVCPTGKQQAFLRDSGTKGLRVRVTAAGAKSFVYERKLDRKTIRRTIVDVATCSIDKACVEARLLGVMLDVGTDPREVDRQQRSAKEDARIVQLEAEKYTLANLLTAYCDYLKSLERKSRVDVRAMFKLHVEGAWPKIAALPANAVSSEQIADMMRRVIELGKDRTANKLRSYIRSAYQIAKAARSKPSIPLAFKAVDAERKLTPRGGNIQSAKTLLLNCLFSSAKGDRIDRALNIDFVKGQVNGQDAQITENEIRVRFPSNDGDDWLLNVNRLSGFGTMGTGRFPNLVNGYCRLAFKQF